MDIYFMKEKQFFFENDTYNLFNFHSPYRDLLLTLTDYDHYLIITL